MLNFVMLSVVMLSVMAPILFLFHFVPFHLVHYHKISLESQLLSFKTWRCWIAILFRRKNVFSVFYRFIKIYGPNPKFLGSYFFQFCNFQNLLKCIKYYLYPILAYFSFKLLYRSLTEWCLFVDRVFILTHYHTTNILSFIVIYIKRTPISIYTHIHTSTHTHTHTNTSTHTRTHTHTHTLLYKNNQMFYSYIHTHKHFHTNMCISLYTQPYGIYLHLCKKAFNNINLYHTFFLKGFSTLRNLICMFFDRALCPIFEA